MGNPNSTALAVSKERLGMITTGLESKRDVIVRLCGGDETKAERYVMSALMEASSKPEIMQCTVPSIVRSVIQAAVLELDLSGGLGEGYLVPFKGQCTLMVGYRGWQRAAANSGWDIVAKPVFHRCHVNCAGDHEGEHFIYSQIPLRVEHSPELDESKRGEYVGTYAAAWRTGGNGRIEKAEWVTAADVQKARAMADRYKPSPSWKAWPDRMRRKLAIARLARELNAQRGSPLHKAVEIELMAERGGGDVDIDRPGDLTIAPDTTLAEGGHGFGPEVTESDHDYGPPAWDDDQKPVDAPSGE